MANKEITERKVDFAKWYTDVVRAARLADYSEVKGCINIEPNGFAIWEKMQSILDEKIKATGHSNVYMPTLIPERLFEREKDLIAGFAPEGAWVTEACGKKLDERMMIRPTSETLFSDYFSKKVKSYRDLPMLLNQWVNVLRWEKETRPFLRSREFLWQEGHTVHSSYEEAGEEVVRMLNVYKDFFYDYLAIPSITGRKTEMEKFAGADYTLTNEALMYDGVFLQSGTSHHLGNRFSKAYDIKFLNKDNKLENCFQTSWGTTTRMIGALIMVHGDDNGLVLPPKIAPRQVAIVPIKLDENVVSAARGISKDLNKEGVTAFVDESDKSAGFKFAEHEVNGIPVRIEIGPRDLEAGNVVLARRDTGEKVTVKNDETLTKTIKDLLDKIQENLLVRATKRRDELTFECNSLKEIDAQVKKQVGAIKADWCGDESCEQHLKDNHGLKSRCILENEKLDKGAVCVVCGKPATCKVVWGKQY